MENPGRKASPSAEVIFRDGFGDRVLFRDAQGRVAQESLILTAELSAARTFEFLLNQRLAELESFDHPSFARIRKVVRMAGPSPRLGITYDHTPGSRLSAILGAMQQQGATNPIDAAISLIRQIVEGMAAFHRHLAGITHGALGPERIVIVNGKVRITDYIMAPAIEQLRFSSERYWRELRVAVAPVPGSIQFDARCDVAQVALIALALLTSRPLRDDESLITLDESRIAPLLTRPLRTWLVRLLHVDQRHGIATMSDALKALDEAVAESSKPAPAPRPPAVVRSPAPPSPSPAPPRLQKLLPPVQRTMPPAEPRVGTMFQPGVSTERAPLFVRKHSPRLRSFATVAVFGVLIAGAFAVAQFVPPPKALLREGTLAVESNPKGAELLIDGRSVGLTPVTVSLKSGQHEIELRSGDRSRAFNVSIATGTHVTQYVEMFPGNTKSREEP